MFKKAHTISRLTHKYARKVTVLLLIGVMLGTYILPTVAYAQAVQVAKPSKEAFTTLATDTKTAETTPFIGEGHGVRSIIPAMADLQASNISAGFVEKAWVRKLAKKHYRPNEDVTVVIENGIHKQYKTELIDAVGNKVALETEEIENGAAKVITIEQPSSFRPGKYTLKVSDNKGGVSTQDFSWGVLAVNTDKSVYTPNEVAKLHFGVLDDGGNMVCDAQVELRIKKQEPGSKEDMLSTDNGRIRVNPECQSHDFTLNPDYDAEYKVGAPGTYEMTLTSQTKNGSYTISDSFAVRDAVPFDVKRVTATRIYPPHTYPVTMEITANQDFEGTITETVPSVFKVGRPGEEIKSDNDEVNAMVEKQVEAAEKNTTDVTNSNEYITAPEEVKNTPFLTSDTLGYSTINDLQQHSGVKAVLGASVPGLGMPFNGIFTVSQEFGESLVQDIHDHDLYESFGMHGHDGIDFAMPEGTPLIAVDAGKILLAGSGDYGTTIVIQHSWGRSYYGHLSGVSVKDGDEVTRGQTIGASGNTGISTGPHLHFGIKPDVNDKENGYYGKVDPAYYLGMKQSATAVLGVSTKLEPEAPVSTDIKILTWKINVKKGDKIKIGYNYLAPRISPQFYTLGPATFTDKNGKEVFHEMRKWQIASDALDVKFKKGSFTKSSSASCPAPCSQSITGVGFRPKAVIFEWTLQTSETTNPNQFFGVGFATSSTQERAVSYWAEDNQDTSDTGKYRSDTSAILMQNTNGTVAAAADFTSFDSDGFTLNWSTNDTNAYIIHYTAIGGSDVSNAKAGSYSIATSGSSQAFTDPGFRPDFLMTIGSFTQSVNTNSAHAKMNIGYASSPTKEGAITILSRDALGTSDSYSQQRTNAFVLALTDAGGQDTIADVASFDSSGFTLNVTDLPAATLPQFYLAIQGGQYDVGSFDQPTTTSQQSITTGFRPSGVSFASFDNGAGTGITASNPLLLGGASRRSGTTWCNDTTSITCTTAWGTRKKITINNSASSENLTNFSLLVKLNSTRIDYSKTQNSGQDIRFVDPSNPNVALDHEIERWNESGDSFVWVKVPQIDAGSTSDYIWMYYDNASVSDGQNATGVWDSNYVMVQHLNETSGTHFDSTYNNNDSVSIDVTAQGSATGKIDGADSFNGTTSDIDMGSGASLDNVRTLTYSAWVNASTFGEGSLGRILDKGTSGSEGGPGFYLCNSGCTNSLRFYQQWSSSAGQWSAPNSIFSTGTLTHVAVTYNGNSTSNDPTFYVNGVAYSPAAEVNTPSGTITNDASFNMRVGNRVDEDRTFNGVIDEARVSNVMRSTEWIEAEYLSGNDSMNSFGAEQAQSADFPVESYSQGSIWSEDVDALGFSDANMYTTTSLGISFGGSNVASVQSFDPSGFTLNWTSADGVARQILYWSAGSITASQEDYRWYKNTNSLTPTTALEDENQSTILAKNKPYARLRTNIATGGNGMNASTQGYKLQYAANQAEAAVGGTSDWCNDTTGITCTAPVDPGGEVSASVPTDWCNDTTGVTCTNEWDSRRKITFNNAASSTALTDFPVLIKLDSTRINYSKTQNSGQDIRFVDPSNPNVVLDHEIETWNESGTSFVWVKIPQIDAKSTTDSVWIYYGNSSVSDGQSATGVWDSNYMGVWHLKEDPAIAGLSGIVDSTSNNNHGTDNGSMDAADQVTGKANGSIAFDGVNDYINVPHNTNLNFANRAPFTISFWINSNAFNGNYTDVMAKDASNRTGWEIYRDSSTNTIWLERRATGGTFLSDCDLSFTPSVWTHMTFRYDGTDLVCYKDTEFTENGLDDTGNMGAPTDSFTIGTWNNSVFFDGILDEVRISNNSRSVDWIKAEYLTTNDQFNTYGSEFSLNEVKQQSSGWQYRKKITFNNAEASGALTDFPILVKLDNSRIDYNKTQNSGQDIRFVDPADPTTVLSHEIESWDENGYSYVWVKVPSLSAGTSDSIWMYYGNPGASDGQNATGVWDSNFRLVQHLEENPGTTCSGSNEACDSTSNANNGNANGSMNSADQVTGKINGSFDFDGTNDYINGTLTGTPITTNFTLSGWVNPANSSSQYNFIALGVNAGNRAYVAYDTGGYFFCESLDGSPVFVDVPSALPAASWYHVTCTQDNGTLRLYVNGTLVDSAASSITIATNNYTLASDISAPSLLLPGKLDETRMSSTARSADWVRVEYLTSADQMNFFGQEQPYAISGTNTAGWTDVADVWCNDTSGITCTTSWANRTKITFNNQASSSNLTNFPVLVKLNSTRIDYNKTQNSGQDIRFVDPADPTTVLDHEIETWDESGDSYVWVEVPQVDGRSASDSIWMYYGNPGASDGQNASGTWNSSYTSVFHLRETGNGTANEFNDSTATNNDGRGGNGTASAVPARTTGIVGFGQNFDGSNDYIQGAQTAVLSGTVAYTIEAWINPDTCGESIGTIFKQMGTAAIEFDLCFTGASNNDLGLWLASSNSAASITNLVTPGQNTWYHVAAVHNGSGTVQFYVNGVPVAMSDSTITPASSAGANIIGQDNTSSSTANFDGIIDELRLSTTNRSADWMQATYLTAADQMNTYSAEESQTSSIWKFKDNVNVSDGTTITSSILSTSAGGNQLTYQESNSGFLNPTAVAVGEKREFDFSLDASGTSNRRTYYFRIVSSDGTPLTSYTRYPSITVGVPNQKVMRGGKFFNYKQSQPFTF